MFFALECTIYSPFCIKYRCWHWLWWRLILCQSIGPFPGWLRLSSVRRNCQGLVCCRGWPFELSCRSSRHRTSPSGCSSGPGTGEPPLYTEKHNMDITHRPCSQNVLVIRHSCIWSNPATLITFLLYTCNKGECNLILKSDQVFSLANLMIDMKYLLIE